MLRLHIARGTKQNKIPAMNILTYFISADYFDGLIKRMSRKKNSKVNLLGKCTAKIQTVLRKRKKIHII